MVKFVTRHEDDDEDGPKELVGSRDLRESFEDTDYISGSFSLNGYEFRNFQAVSPAGVVAAINAATGMTGVTASVDDHCHLVLLNSSADDILITLGAPYEPPMPAAGSVADEVVARLKAEHEKEYGKSDRENHVLHALGLPESAVEDQQRAPRPGFETGLSAEERKARRDEAVATGQKSAEVFKGSAGQGNTSQPSRNPSAPVMETGDGSRTVDGLGRTGTGEGYQTKPDGTPPVPGAGEAKQAQSHPGV